MDKVGITLIVLFILLLIVGPMTCVTLSRRDGQKITNPQPEHFDRARRKLRAVATSSNAPRARISQDDFEGGGPQQPAECPICIGVLAPEPAHARSEQVRQLPEVEQVTSVTLEAHPFGSYLKRATVPQTQRVPEDPEIYNEILTLRSCGHSFHFKCLSSWFLLQRHDCPVCRAPYYKSRFRRLKPVVDPTRAANYTV